MCTGIKLELLTDPDMLLMFERGIRGEITQEVCKYVSANNKYMGDKFSHNKDTTYLQYLDVNNLYGWAMSQPLPTGGFKWVDVNPNEISELATRTDKGYLLEVDVSYPKELHNPHNDLLFMCERMEINGVEKLVPNLRDKKNYVIHIQVLNQVLQHGLKLDGLRNLGFDIHRGKVTARQTVMLNKAAEELLSESDITGADDIELQEIVEKALGIISQIKDVQTDAEDLFENPLRELLGLDKQLRSIRGSLKVEVAKKVELEEHITKERRKLEEFWEYLGVYDDTMKKDITKRINALNDELATRQEFINLLKGRLKSQITSFKETIAKVLDKDTSLGEKIRTLLREQGITIASILTAIGMAIRVLVEALLPGGGDAAVVSGGGEPPPKDEKCLKNGLETNLKL